MTIRFYKILVLFTVVFYLVGCTKTETDQNGNPFKIITIGKQLWMAENLNVDKFRNGDPIPEVRTIEEWMSAGKMKQPAWCYYNNDPAYEHKYGRLYNWYAITDPRGLAPEGWSIPDDEDWFELTEYLGGPELAGPKLKSKDGWNNNQSGTNSSGFNGLPGGYRDNEGKYVGIGEDGMWWSSTEHENDDSWYTYVSENAFNVRCIKK